MRRKTVTILMMALIMSSMAGCGKEEAPIEVEVVDCPWFICTLKDGTR